MMNGNMSLRDNKLNGLCLSIYSPKLSAYDKAKRSIFMKKRKILILGGKGVGKTTLINNFIFDDIKKREE